MSWESCCAGLHRSITQSHHDQHMMVHDRTENLSTELFLCVLYVLSVAKIICFYRSGNKAQVSDALTASLSWFFLTPMFCLRTGCFREYEQNGKFRQIYFYLTFIKQQLRFEGRYGL